MSRSKSESLTLNMEMVLAFYKDQIAVGSRPTLRKIADKMGWKATATAFEVLRSLRERKLLPLKKKKRSKLPNKKTSAFNAQAAVK